MIDEVVKTKFLNFLKSKSVAVISTVSETCKPESATIYFAVDDDFTFYFMTKSFTRKYKNLEKNPEVSLVVGTENVPVTVQIQGRAERIEDEIEIDKRLEQLRATFTKNDFVGPLFELVGEKNEVLLFKITPSWIRWLDMREGTDHNEFLQVLP
jgi:general stress protein 26